MSGRTRDRRDMLQRAIGGERNAVRAEQLRALGLSNLAIARQLKLPVEAVSNWFALQDDLVFGDDVDGAA